MYRLLQSYCGFIVFEKSVIFGFYRHGVDDKGDLAHFIPMSINICFMLYGHVDSTRSTSALVLVDKIINNVIQSHWCLTSV